jgi:hypothetical protein
MRGISITAIALIFWLTSYAVSSDPLFHSRLDFWVGGNSNAVVGADLDGDGDEDLAMTYWQANFISVLINDGQGIFADTVNYQAGEDACSITAADFDGDGNQDLATANGDAQNISILFNNGDATFQDPVNYTVGGAPVSIFAADINGDNYSDLLVGSGNVGVLINNGDGTFQNSVYYETGVGCSGVYTADIDGDGDADLAIIGDYNIITYLNVGDGTFQDSVFYDIEYSPNAVCAADLNNDNYPDLVAVSHMDPYIDGNIMALMNNGDGTFQDPVYWGGSGNSVFAVDLDGDEDIDLATSDAYYLTWAGYNYIVLNNGDGTFQTPIKYDSPGAWGVFAADFDSDRDNDLAAVGYQFASVFVNNGDATFQEPENYEVEMAPRSLAANDLDGDGDNDLAVANDLVFSDSIGLVSVYLNHGDGTFQDYVNYSTLPATYSVYAADLDGDDDKDLVTANDLEPPDNVSMLLNNGDGTFQEAVNYTAGIHPKSIFAADLDNDGDNDLAVADSGSNDVSIFINNGNATFQDAAYYSVADYPTAVISVDFNNDGFNDIATANKAISYDVSVLLNNGNGTFQPAVNYEASWRNSMCSSIFAADFNGDNYQDLVVGHAIIDKISIFLNNGDGSFQDAIDYESGYGVSSVFAADLDGDGDSDVAATNIEPSNVTVFSNNGDGSFERDISYGVPRPPLFARGADFDGDEDIDLAVTSYHGPGTGCISILSNLSNTTHIDQEELPVPESFISCSYPNPFNAVTTISYSLPEPGQVTMSIYNLLGQRVATVFEGTREAGEHTISWDARDFPSGVYFARLEAGEHSENIKMVLLK